jgi:hypothetical protein
MVETLPQPINPRKQPRLGIWVEQEAKLGALIISEPFCFAHPGNVLVKVPFIRWGYSRDFVKTLQKKLPEVFKAHALTFDCAKTLSASFTSVRSNLRPRRRGPAA